MPNETALKAQVIDYLRERGAYVVKNWGSPLSGRGLPDLFVCYRGRFVAFELKHPRMTEAAMTNAVSASQWKHIDAITQAGGLAVVVNSVADVGGILDTMDHDTERRRR